LSSKFSANGFRQLFFYKNMKKILLHQIKRVIVVILSAYLKGCIEKKISNMLCIIVLTMMIIRKTKKQSKFKHRSEQEKQDVLSLYNNYIRNLWATFLILRAEIKD